MPELHSLQTYLSLAERAPGEVFAMHARFVERVGLWGPEMRAWFESLEWSPADDGVAYAGHAPSAIWRGLTVQPYILGWTPRVIGELRSDWLELGVWLRSEQVSRQSTLDFRYRPEAARAIYELASSFMPLLVDSPLFLTDEVQDGKPWQSWMGSGDDPWAFDLAIAPNCVAWPRDPTPPDLSHVDIPGGRAFARPSRWCELPWMT